MWPMAVMLGNRDGDVITKSCGTALVLRVPLWLSPSETKRWGRATGCQGHGNSALFWRKAGIVAFSADAYSAFINDHLTFLIWREASLNKWFGFSVLSHSSVSYGVLLFLRHLGLKLQSLIFLLKNYMLWAYKVLTPEIQNLDLFNDTDKIMEDCHHCWNDCTQFCIYSHKNPRCLYQRPLPPSVPVSPALQDSCEREWNHTLRILLLSPRASSSEGPR